MPDPKDNDILNFFYEMGMLKRIKHEGWRVIGINDLDSVADHSLRSAQIGYILAMLENYHDPEEVCTMLVFHDMGEARIGDIHKLARRYVDKDEERAVKEQTKNLGKMGQEVFTVWKNYKNNKAGIIAEDANLLEVAITAQEYIEKGHKEAQDWINNVNKRLKTSSAKRLLKQLSKTNSNDWWKGLKKIDL